MLLRSFLVVVCFCVVLGQEEVVAVATGFGLLCVAVKHVLFPLVVLAAQVPAGWLSHLEVAPSRLAVRISGGSSGVSGVRRLLAQGLPASVVFLLH